jgi:hypothetical protein
LNELLKTVREWLPDETFPVDSRTILRTPRKTNIIEMGSGSFYHFGVANGIQNALELGINDFTLPKLGSLEGIENLLTLKINWQFTN